jgi:glycosyltransferase involved in cell wall biosynthesis
MGVDQYAMNQQINPRIVIACNTSWNLVNFRSGLIRALVATGYEVIALAPQDTYSSQLARLGCRFIAMPMDNNGTHPGRDLMLLVRYIRVLRSLQPGAYLSYTVKPNIYGSMAAHWLNIPVVNNIAGLGTAFIKGGWLNRVVRHLYRAALSRSARVFFQNSDDRDLFISGRLVAAEKTDTLPGSGIDLQKFVPHTLPTEPPVRFLLVARMLWDKGVGEFVAAARILKQRNLNVECCLLGFLDSENPVAVSAGQIDEWEQEGVVSYLGTSDDVAEQVNKASCVVLPSYREGLPRALLEAAAMARPVVTTDAVGCRDVVNDGMSGYLCRLRDPEDLADKMEQIAALSPAERRAMGLRGRAKVEREFDEKIVIQRYLDAVASVLQKAAE